MSERSWRAKGRLRRGQGRRRFRPLARWFLPEVPEVLGLLLRQAEITVSGLEAFERWAAGEPGAEASVRAAEHAADGARRSVLGALRSAFTTPVEPEDLFELSERLDGVLNQAKDVVREAEVLGMGPDRPMAEMTRLVLLAGRDLRTALAGLDGGHDAAIDAADAAIGRQRRIEHVYRHAMSGLLAGGDAREIAARRELYRRYARIGEAVEAVADRVWYAVVKRS